MSYDFLLPKATVSFQTIRNHKICNGDINSITLNNCTFEESDVKATDFSNSDFSGSRLLKCSFTDTKLNNADICSVFAVDTDFSNVTFESATISDCTFIRCKFGNCNFNHVNMTNTQFESCSFQEMTLLQSTTSLNQFVNTIFENCRIQGNFFYNLMVGCEFINSSMEKELFGYNFGMIQMLDEREDIDDLIESFQDNNMLLNLTILHINLESKLYDKALLVSVFAIGKMLEADLLIRSEQITFFKILFDYMFENGLVAPITIIQSWSVINSAQKVAQGNTATVKAREQINALTNSLYQKYQEFMIHIQQIPNWQGGLPAVSKQAVLIEIQYKNKPDIPLIEFLGDMQDLCSIDAPRPVLVKSKTGSFYEWIQSYDSVVLCLQLLFSLLGVGLSAWQFNMERKKLVQKDTEQESAVRMSTGESLQNYVDVSQILPLIQQSSVSPETERMVHNGITVIFNHNVVNNISFSGYNANNIVKVDVSPHIR